MAIGDLWLAGSNPDDIYRSTDEGVSWDSTGISAPAGQTAVNGIAVAPNGDLWLVGTIPDDIYRSTDNGVSWDSTGISAPAGQTAVNGIAVAPNGDLWLVGSTPDDIYRSTDNGVTWDSTGISAPAGQTAVNGIAVAPNGDLWLVGLSSNDIYRSTDGGVTWSSTGISAPAGQTFVTGIAVAPNGDLWLVGSTPDDIYRSTDEGVSWDSTGISAPAGQTSVQGIAFDPRSASSAPSFADDTGDAQSWTQGTAITNFTVPAASGSPTPTYAVVGILPAGISFDALVLSGTPTALGSGTITVRATNSEGTADWTVDYTVSAFTPTLQTIALGVPLYTDANTSIWSSDDDLDPAFTVAGSDNVGIGSFTINSTGSVNLNLFGGTDALLDSLEIKDYVFTLQVAGVADLVIAGPNHPSNTSSDATEPYSWTPDNAAEVTAFLAALTANSAATLIISNANQAPANEATGSFDAGLATFTGVAEAAIMPAVAPTVTLAPVGFIYADEMVELEASVAGGTYDALSYLFEIVTGSGSLSPGSNERSIVYTPIEGETPEIRVTVTATGDGTDATNGSSDTDDTAVSFSVRTALTLDSINTAGRDIDAAAVLVRTTADSESMLYADANRGGTDVPLYGELGLSAGETNISGIRLSATFLLLLDSDDPAALNFGTYMGAGGDGNDLRMHLRNDTTEETVEVADVFTDGNANRVRFSRAGLPQAFDDILSGYSQGDRLGIAFTRAGDPNELTASFDAASPEFNGAATAQPYNEMVGSFDAAAPQFVGVAEAVPVQALEGSFDATAATFEGTAEGVAFNELEASFDAGVAEFAGVAELQPIVLSDWTQPAGTDLQFACVLERTDTQYLFVSPARGGTDAPIEGSISFLLGPPITRMGLISGPNRLRINDNLGAFNLESYFQPGGNGNDIVFHFQTSPDGDTAQLDVETYYPGDANAGGNNIYFGADVALPDEFVTFLSNIAVGRRFVFAATRPAAIAYNEAIGEFDATAADFEGVAAAQPYNELEASFAATAAEFEGVAETVPFNELTGSFDAQPATLGAVATDQPYGALSGSFDASGAQFIGVAEALPYNELEASFDAQPATFSGDAIAQVYGELLGEFEAGTSVFDGTAEEQPYNPLTAFFEAEPATFTGVAEAVPITLSDWTQPPATDLVFAAILERTEAAYLYRSAARGGTDVPIEGDLDLLPTGNPITRLTWVSSDVFVIHDNLPLILEDFFQPAGDGHDITFYLQVIPSGPSVSFDVETYYPGDENAAAQVIRFGQGSAPDLPATIQDLLDSIAIGTRYLFAATRAVEDNELVGSFDSALATFEGTAENQPYNELSGFINAEPAEFNAVASAQPYNELNIEFNSASAMFEGTAEAQPYGELEADLEAGIAELDGVATAQPYMALSGSFDAQAAVFEGVAIPQVVGGIEGSFDATPATFSAVAEAQPYNELTASFDSIAATFVGVAEAVPIVLSDWTQPMGTVLLFAALIERTDADYLYRSAERGGTDVPIEGNLNLIAGGNPITRIGWLNSDVLVVNENDSVNLEDFFQAGGDGNDITFYLQTAPSGLYGDFEVETYYPGDANAGPNNIRFGEGTDLPADVQTILDGIAVGTRYIIAATRAAADNELVGSFDAGAPVFVGVAESQPYSEVVASFDATAATFVGVAADVPYNEAEASFDAQPAQFIGSASSQAVSELIGSFDAASPQFIGIIEEQPYNTLRGSFDAQPAVFDGTANAQVYNEPIASFDAQPSIFRAVAGLVDYSELEASFGAGVARFRGVADSDGTTFPGGDPTDPTDPPVPPPAPGGTPETLIPNTVRIPLRFLFSDEVDGATDIPTTERRIRIMFSRGGTGQLTEDAYCLTESADTLPDLPLDAWVLRFADLAEGVVVGDTTWYNHLPDVSEEVPFGWRAQRPYMTGQAVGEAVVAPWAVPVIVAHYGKDGRDGKPGVAGRNGNIGHSHVDTLTNFEPVVADVDSSGDWRLSNQDADEAWPETTTFRVVLSNDGKVADFMRILVGSIVSFVRNGSDYADYTVTDPPRIIGDRADRIVQLSALHRREAKPDDRQDIDPASANDGIPGIGGTTTYLRSGQWDLQADSIATVDAAQEWSLAQAEDGGEWPDLADVEDAFAIYLSGIANHTAVAGHLRSGAFAVGDVLTIARSLRHWADYQIGGLDVTGLDGSGHGALILQNLTLIESKGSPIGGGLADTDIRVYIGYLPNEFQAGDSIELRFTPKGAEGADGIQGTQGFSHSLVLTDFKILNTDVVADGDWSLQNGGQMEWPSGVNTDLRIHATDEDIAGTIERITPGSTLTLYREEADWAEYRIMQMPVKTGNTFDLLNLASIVAFRPANAGGFTPGDDVEMRYSPGPLHGTDGLPGPRGLSGYGNSQFFTDFVTTPGANGLGLTMPGQWHLFNATGMEWPENLGNQQGAVWLYNLSSTSADEISRIVPGSLITLYKDKKNWVDYQVGAITVMTSRVRIDNLTFIESVGSPSFAAGDDIQLHFNPIARDGINGKPGRPGYTRRFELLRRRTSATNFALNGDWYWEGGGGSAWPENTVLSFRTSPSVDDNDRRALLNVFVGSVLAIYKDDDNFADYQVDAQPTQHADGYIHFSALSMNESAGEASIAANGAARLLVNPAAINGINGEPYIPPGIRAGDGRMNIVLLENANPSGSSNLGEIRLSPGNYYVPGSDSPRATLSAARGLNTPYEGSVHVDGVPDDGQFGTFYIISGIQSTGARFATHTGSHGSAGDSGFFYAVYRNNLWHAGDNNATHEQFVPLDTDIVVAIGYRALDDIGITHISTLVPNVDDGQPGVRGFGARIRWPNALAGGPVPDDHGEWWVGTGANRATSWEAMREADTLRITTTVGAPPSTENYESYLKQLLVGDFLTIFNSDAIDTQWQDYVIIDPTPVLHVSGLLEYINFSIQATNDNRTPASSPLPDDITVLFGRAAEGAPGRTYIPPNEPPPDTMTTVNPGGVITTTVNNSESTSLPAPLPYRVNRPDWTTILTETLLTTAVSSISALGNMAGRGYLIGGNLSPVMEARIELTYAGTTVETDPYVGIDLPGEQSFVVYIYDGSFVADNITAAAMDVPATTTVTAKLQIRNVIGISNPPYISPGKSVIETANLRIVSSSGLAGVTILPQSVDDKMAVQGQSFPTFTARAEGGSPPYTWELELPQGLTGISISNAGTITGTIPAATPMGDYEVTIIATDESDVSARIKFTLMVTVETDALSVIASPTTVPSTGNNRRLTAAASGGTSPYTYQWQSRASNSGNWTDYSVSNGTDDEAILIIPNSLTLSGGRQFRCVVTDNATNEAISSTITITSIVATISRSAPFIGHPVTCTVTGNSGTPAFQWQWNDGGTWRSVSGVGTNATFTIRRTNGVGLQIRCEVVVDGMTIYSPVATVTADDHGNTIATATALARNGSLTGVLNTDLDIDYFRIDVPSSGELVVRTTGTANTEGELLDSNGTSLDTDNNSGSGNNFRITRNVSAGTYYVAVTLAAGANSPASYGIANTLTGTIVSGTVNPQTVPTTGNNRTITATPSGGSTPYSYQWQRRIGSGAWTDYNTTQATGETTATIRFNNSYTIPTNYQFRCKLTDSNNVEGFSSICEVHSTNALSASVAPLLLPAPWESESPDSFVATATGGSGGYTYSWEWAYVSTSSVLEPTPNSWAAVVGSALAPTFTGGSTRTIGRVDPDPLSFDIDRFFRMRCRVQDSNGASVYTPTVRIGLPPALSASVSPNTLNATGSNRSLTCTAGGGASPYNYQWQRRIGNGAWADYSSSQASGETSRTIQFGNSQVLDDSWEFRCEVTDNDSTVAYTTSVPVTSIPALVVSARPTTIPETGIDRDLFCETAGGSTPYSWQWQRRIGSGAWADYSSSQASGETAQQMFIFNSLTLGLTWEFRCEVTDDDGTVAYTNEVTVEDVVVSLSATVSPNSLPETGSNRSTTCTARNGSGGYSYQWQVNTGSGFADYNSSNATGETTATLRFNDSYTIPTGWSFRCEVTDSDNTIVVSNEVFIDDVAPPPEPEDIHGDTRGTATFISANSNTAGQINPENDVDYFRFSVSAAGTITISTSGAADLDGRLENSSGTALQTDTTGEQVYIQAHLSGGTYYIRLVERGDQVTLLAPITYPCLL